MLRLWCCIFFLFQFADCYASSNPEDKKQLTSITPSLRYFIDTTNSLKVENVVKLDIESMMLSNKQFLSLNPQNHPIWLYLKIDSTKRNPHIVFDTHMADSIIVYYAYQDGTFERQLHGLKVKKEDRNANSILPIFNIPASNTSIWVKIVTTSPFVFKIEQGTGYEVNQYAVERTLAMGFFFFLLLFIFIANFVLAIALKTRDLYYFGFFNFFTLCFISLISGFCIYLPGNLEYYLISYITPILCLLIISGMLLSINVLDIYNKYKRTFYVLMFLLLICVGSFVLYFAGFQELATAIVNPLGGLVVPVYIFTSFKAYKNGQKYALYFFIGWALYYLVLVSIILYLLGILPPGEYVNYLTPSISVIDFIFILATIFSRINFYRMAKEKAEREQFKLVQEQNEILKVKVDERTTELLCINEEFASQNEELISQKEHISTLNTFQEQIIEEKTLELQNTLIYLQKRNNDLEHFSYVVSHNLRAPIASILGLTNIFNKNNIEDPVNLVVVEKLNSSALSLDTVIKDLNYIISANKVLEVDFVPVDLNKVLLIIKDLLNYEIINTKTSIDSDFSQLSEMVSIPTYMHNIFYNLISNSIKYRKEGVEPKIRIISKCHAKATYIHFIDNGIGIDLQTFQPEKLFQLFKRVNYSIEGKGIGLYLVKSQVDFLNGSIEVKSEVGVGTEFVVILPDQQLNQKV